MPAYSAYGRFLRWRRRVRLPVLGVNWHAQLSMSAVTTRITCSLALPPLASLLLGLLHEFLAAALLRHATGSSVAASASGRSTIKRSQYGQLAGSVGGILSLFLPSIHSAPKLAHSNRAGRRRCYSSHATLIAIPPSLIQSKLQLFQVSVVGPGETSRKTVVTDVNFEPCHT